MDDIPIVSAEPDAEVRGKKAASTEANPHDFGAAEEALNDAARRVNTVWISFILLCVYIFITTFTVTPAALFRAAPVTLPIFNAIVPLKVYFVITPFLILAVHAYLVVLTKGLAEKIVTYEAALERSSNPSASDADSRRALRSRLDNSILVRAISTRFWKARGSVDYASRVIAFLTIIVMPVALLLLTQLIFLPYQDERMTWTHRVFVFIDVGLCLWLLSPAPSRLAMARRLLVSAFIVGTSVSVAAFPGEMIYTWFDGLLPHDLTVKYFEGPLDPVDYVHKGGVLLFPNRLILPDDPKLTETVGASSGDISLSVRGRNFRKAVFDRSNLTRVDFSAADLEDASLKGAKLEAAKFECARPAIVVERDDGLSGSYDSSYTPGGDHDCTILNGAKLPYAKLGQASFKSAQLSGAELRSASLNGATFDKAEMSGADLLQADVENAVFSYSVLIGANFSGANGRAVNFSGTRLTAANFADARLRAANFNGARLQGARLSRAELIAADFNNAHMQGVDSSGAILAAASLEGAYLQDARLDNSNIKGASFISASLQGASLKCVTPFRTTFVSDIQVLVDNIRTKIPNADLSQTVVNYPNVKCEPDYGMSSYYPDSMAYYGPEKYDLKDDHVPGGGTYGSGYADGWHEGCDLCTNIYTRPEELDTKSFENQLSRLLSDLTDEELKARVRAAFEHLKPGARTKAQDESEKTFWSDWAKKTAPQDSHDKALAARLEAIACVADGAPYVARGLLRAGRFDRLYENKETNHREKIRILERLRKASGGGDPSCLGAKGLVITDFPKAAL